MDSKAVIIQIPALNKPRRRTYALTNASLRRLWLLLSGNMRLIKKYTMTVERL